MLAAEQNIFLQLGVLNLVIFYQHIFPDNFDGVLFAVKLAGWQKDFSERSAAKKGNKGKILVLDLAVFTVTDENGLSAQWAFIV